jgi:hypothetical protein
MTLKSPVLIALVFILFAPALLIAGTCQGGPDNGQFCTQQSSCHSWCNGGPNNFQICASQANCPSTCQGGLNNGSVCTLNSQCTAGGGFCHLNPCTFSPCVLSFASTASTTGSAACSSQLEFLAP